MSSAIRIALSAVIACLAVSCTPRPPKLVKSDISPGIGPFDSQGNYREDWADDPSKWRRPTNPPPVANNTTSSSSSRGSSSSSPPPPKPKPSVTRHTVRRGDTLSHIARRYGSTVSGIRRANGISGSLIYPGQRLVIPRR
ncbi:MAG: LysM peptidoglycan-binding domain-containing protein [Akkermansiaceae bacterium]|nr:LysM peptidoglycan-binding domain-containing protein [Akkermansiaceae bacterium]